MSTFTIWGISLGVPALLLAIIRLIYVRLGRRKERERQARAGLEARSERERIDDAVAGRTEGEIKSGLRRWQKGH